MIYIVLAFMLLQSVCCLDIITTIAGTGTSSYSGDGGAATSATLYYPQGVALDASGRTLYHCLLHSNSCTSWSCSWLLINIPTPNIGNVYVADQYNNRIRKVTVSTGIITTIAGTGTYSFSGDNGAATSAALYWPSGVAVDASGRAL